ncbi:dTDPD-glucose 4,6-dehydratase [Cedratvirus A11]|uniref:dTDPD-glucose 4,6-dehydratase n=1 Tax=Cedratvirus A11 TaxID=1903266 RepID=A0A1M7XU65_9VIRU|nr:nucleotide-sugar epimerase [Cedratvirus A11]SHO33225.1 dTDPD-glucose 4,6-dehydratase [Cedratvirus A11]
MRILVTGGCGFIASHVIVHLHKTYPDYYIVNLDKLDYCSSLHQFKTFSGSASYKFIQGNILSMDLLKHIFREEKIDTVMHFAAHTHVDNSFDNSLDFTMNNVVGTHNLLHCAKEFSVKRFIHVSTDEVKGENDDVSIDSIFMPTNPYAASKAGAELLASSYRLSFSLPVIITRCNNVYGPYQYPEKIIPKFTSRLLKGQKCIIQGDGSNERNYIHASDVARAFDVVLHQGQVGKIYNICSEDCLSNLEVYTAICEELGLSKEAYLEFGQDRPFNDKRYHICGNELASLGWKQSIPFSQGIKETVLWYKSLEEFVWMK